jgi:copper transport protein
LALTEVPLWLLATLAGAAALVVSLSLSGHAVTGRWEPLGFVADLVHVSAAAVWVGGLLVLAGVLFWTLPHADQDELEGVVRRFSATAVVAVAAIVASGVFQAWRQVGSWSQLTETDYGTVLLLKVTLVAAAVEAGWFSRRWVNTRFRPPADPVAPAAGPASRTAAGANPTETGAGREADAAGRRPPGPGAASASRDLTGGPGRRSTPAGPPGTGRPDRQGPTAARFRRWLAFEAAIGIGIVAMTGVLIDTAPPQGERVAATARAYTGRSAIGPNHLLSVAVYPLVPGTVHVAIQLTNRATEPVDAFQVTAQLSLPARKIGPIQVTLTHQATGSWVGDNV